MSNSSIQEQVGEVRADFRRIDRKLLIFNPEGTPQGRFSKNIFVNFRFLC